MIKASVKTSIAGITLRRYGNGNLSEEKDLLAVEEPLEIRLGYGPKHHREQNRLLVTMRTPGHDEELAMGFLYSEGIIQSAEDVIGVRYCRDIKKPEEEGNVIRMELSPEVEINWEKLDRKFSSTASCGVCGKSSIDAVKTNCQPSLFEENWEVHPEILLGLPEKMQSRQSLFAYTGGIHAAALFSRKGELILMREDVGRHNALDKLIGAALILGLVPLRDYMILVSGRVGFELVQKAAVAGCPMLLAIGAPSSLSVDLARECGMTLLGFLKKNRFNLYSGEERVS